MENAHIHGGSITAENASEGGAVFTLRLPRDASRLAPDQDRDTGTGTDTGTDGGGAGRGDGR
jgi:two-component system sensor histidine kinase MtrB